MSECSHEHERGAVCGNCGHRLGYLLYESEQAIAFERALSDSLMKINDELKDRIAELEAEVKRLREALEIIAGKRQCINNLMSNVEIAEAALLGGGE